MKVEDEDADLASMPGDTEAEPEAANGTSAGRNSQILHAKLRLYGSQKYSIQ
jgi:hypothetical protein